MASDYVVPSDPDMDSYMKTLEKDLPPELVSFCDEHPNLTIDQLSTFARYLDEKVSRMRDHAADTVTIADFEKAKGEKEEGEQD